jgi:hypothetical protein
MIGYWRGRRNRVGRGVWVVAVLVAAIGVAGLAGSGRAAVLYLTSTSVNCQPTSVVVGNASVCIATVTDIVSRRVTPTGAVSFTSDSPGLFGAGGSCALAPTGTAGVASCPESYSPSAAGSGAHTITAGYGGDRLHSASHGATTVTVSAPAPAYTLTVSLAGAGTGTIAGSGIACPKSCAQTYPSGTRVSLAVTPAAGSTFDGWSGACTGADTCNVTMTADQAVSANFSNARSGCSPNRRQLLEPMSSPIVGALAGPPIPMKCCAHVSTRSQLIGALAAGAKCIFVADNAQIDLAQVNDQRSGAPDWVVHVPDGVSIESGRSPRTPGGLLYMSHRLKQTIMLDVGSNTRISGLRLRGPNQWDTAPRQDGAEAIMVDGRAQSGRVVVHNDLIDNNEIYGWPTAGVNVIDATPGDASIRITGNFIHNSVQCGVGYGVVVSGSGFPVIDRNVFDWNRHDVSSDGRYGTGYRAELNFVLTDGPTCGGHYNQHFDVHGTGPKGYGGPAGQNYEILNNTIRGAQDFFLGAGVRPAFELRGIPAEATFADNAVVHDDESDAINIHDASLSEDQLRANGELVVYGNRYKVWTAGELAVGHFGNDGCSDVFQATGAVWVYSPCGRGIWRFLNQSRLRLDRLAFGDFNGDTRTDVFSQSGGQWLVSYGGTGPWTPLPAGSSIPMKQYRFGDFNGDGKTDVFRANGSRFYYSSAGATAWKPLAFSHFTIGQLRFGDFQQPGRTDVFSLANGHWSVSYGGATHWQPLNLQLSSNLAELAFADLDGDGRTDIARCHDGTAEVSWNGTTPWRQLQFACRDGFPGLLFGNFTGSKRADVLSAGAAPTLLNRYRLSRSGRTPFFQWSLNDML